MMRKTANVLWTTLMVGAWIGAGVATAAGPTMPTEKNFLMKAAGGQMAEIALGKMATERAESEKVKQFGSRMVEDHQKAKQEVTQLASQAGVELPASIPAMHKEKAQQLSQLSGKEFDRAYIKDMLRDHMKDVVEFEHSAMELKDPKVKQWASATLPVLKEHLQMVKSLASDLGIASQ
jgi:putative membrane protein